MQVGEAMVTGASQGPKLAGGGRAGPTPTWRVESIQGDGAGGFAPPARRHNRCTVLQSRRAGRGPLKQSEHRRAST